MASATDLLPGTLGYPRAAEAYLRDGTFDAAAAVAAGLAHVVGDVAVAAGFASASPADRRLLLREAFLSVEASARDRGPSAPARRRERPPLRAARPVATAASTDRGAAADVVEALVAAALGTTVDGRAPLLDAGLDSLASAELVQRLNAALDLQLPATTLESLTGPGAEQ